MIAATYITSLENFAFIYTLLYKQHFYKQCQAEIDKKLSKRFLKIIRFLHTPYHQKIIGDIFKNIQKSASVAITLYD